MVISDGRQAAVVAQDWASLDQHREVDMTARKTRILCVVACVALIATPVFAGGDGPGGNPGSGVCTLDGAWLGVFPAWEVSGMIVYDSDSHWTGPISLEMIGFDPTFNGAFPDATVLSGFTGTWMRTGRRTFDYTMIAYGLDAVGQPVYIGKNIGSLELSGNCDVLDVYSATISFYLPTQDPFGEEPGIPGLECIPDESTGTAQRIPVQPPCEPPPP